MNPEWDSEQRRSIAYSFIRSGVEQGLSGASVLKSLQAEGLGYRQGDFYDDWRKETGEVKYQPLIAALKGDTLIPRAWTPYTELNLTTNYQYVIEYTAVNPETGASYKGYWCVSEDEQLSKDEVLDYVGMFLTTTELAEGYELEETIVQRGWQRTQTTGEQ